MLECGQDRAHKKHIEWCDRYRNMSSSVRDGILASAIGGLLVAAVLATWDAAALWLWNAALALWSFSWLPIPLPLWIVAVVAVAVFVRFARWTALRWRVPQLDVMKTTRQTVQLDTGHWQVLKTLAQADGSPLTLDSLHAHTGINQLRLTAYLDELEARDLVEARHNYALDYQIYLTRRGRDLLMQEGVV